MTTRRYPRAFWLLWASSVVSGLGDGVRFVALPLLAASLTRDPLLIASVTVAGQLPWLLVGPLTGVMTDRLDRRRLAWRVAALQGVVMAAFTAVVAAQAAGVALIALAAFVMSSAETLAGNVSAALVPDLVKEEDRLASANSWVQGGQFVTSDLVGLSIGAVLFGAAQFLPFAFDAVSFALAAVLLLGIGRRDPARDKPPGSRLTVALVRADLAEGMRWLLRHRLLRAICALIALSNFAVVAVMAIAVLYALEVLGVSRHTYGLLMVVIALGGVAGLVAAPWLARRLGYGRTLRLTFLLSPLPFLITGLTSRPLVAASSFFFVGASISIGNVVSMSLRQKLVPSQIFGRVNSFYRLLALGLGPLGGAFGGLLGGWLGLRSPFLFGAALLTVTVLLAFPLLSDRAVAAAEAEREAQEDTTLTAGTAT